MGDSTSAKPQSAGPREGLPELRRVLAPTDLSPTGNAAIPYAYALASRGGTVHLMHVIELPAVPSPLYAHYEAGRRPTREQREAQREAIHQQLAALVPAAAQNLGIATEIEVLEAEDDVAGALCEAAGRLGVDAICIASHGHGGILEKLIGSVVEHLLHHADRPTFVVRAGRE
jgi:nucleotide-binding universal stress UspA family protein